ncbi:carboxypeptidase-like regulatory domain-containing protein [Chitinophaga filiformis]|uniref:carboxypeptidase-like regulatory domain-containing protein n=1 Tax=Chitinophaga filiformis TaxID=104663 RepID=UPI001F2F8FC2|nr:carboxypeptidase-like regulatory domain-containing protein [Chitinophaga filiformis]MCF6402278.1 carboxypeptidase-like regulatory domain-containing protein [Chitinophaga filiformis]
MKTQTSIILSIPQPCHESWNEMTSVDKGRFCQRCQKTVTDFSALSDAQIIELLKSKQASACGRFTASQLNRVISVPLPEKRRKPFISVAAVIAALTITMPSVKAATSMNKIEQTADQENKPAPGNVKAEGSAGFISGIVKADKDGLPLPYATIKIKDRPIGTVTDQSGKFTLRIPDDFKRKVITLEVSFIGYEKRSIKVLLQKDLKPLDIRLNEDKTRYGQYGIHFNTDDKKGQSLWGKFNSAMRGIFS